MNIIPLNQRVLDTRTSGGAFPKEGTRTVICSGLPPNTKSVLINTTVVDPPAAGYLTAWPSGTRPVKSFNPYPAGPGGSGGFTLVGLTGFGTFELYAKGGGHVIVDVVGAVV